MGWAYCGEDRHGRPIGYGIEATCDQPGCTAEIDRGMGCACGGEHGEDTHFCDRYFCGAHLYYVLGFPAQLCPGCANRFVFRRYYLAPLLRGWRSVS